jgi:hypothetical protein
MGYYSEEKSVFLNPLSNVDQKAFDFIRAIDQRNPYDFTGWGTITSFDLSQDLADNLMVKFPSSTFAELTCLELAYVYARQANKKPEMKPRVQQYLEKPLASSFDFVCYLAELLKEDNYEYKYRSRWILYPYKIDKE